MIFQAVIPFGGIVGLKFLERAADSQAANFAKDPVIARETEYFRANIAKAETAEDLVADYRMLRVALGAFGLDDDINKQFYIRKVLEEGTSDPGALANRLVDKRYEALSNAFGFGSVFGAKTKSTGFADRIIAAYQTRQYEISVGDKDQNLRLALGFRREIADIAASTITGDTKWLKVLGSPPLRRVFDVAFNLPTEFSRLDLDRQLEVLRARAGDLLGDSEITALSDAGNVEKVLHRFLARSGTGATGQASGSSAALSLLQSVNSGSSTAQSLFAALV